MYVVKDTRIPNSSSGGHAKGGISKATSKPKKKREVLSADAQNRKIAEIEGMLDNYDKKSMHRLQHSAYVVEKPAQAESESEDESDDDVSSDDSD